HQASQELLLLNDPELGGSDSVKALGVGVQGGLRKSSTITPHQSKGRGRQASFSGSKGLQRSGAKPSDRYLERESWSCRLVSLWVLGLGLVQDPATPHRSDDCVNLLCGFLAIKRLNIRSCIFRNTNLTILSISLTLRFRQPHHFISHPSICLHIYQTVFLTPIHPAILRDTSKLDTVDLTKGSFLTHRRYRVRYSSIRRWVNYSIWIWVIKVLNFTATPY
ncbi:hypothetical protein GOODEAATRI_030778, partial [Goodea atripinnis]